MISLPANALRRLAQSTVTIAAMAVIALAMPVSPARADYCEVIGCQPQCRLVPGGRVCREVCTRRCWRAPPPRYEPPQYAPQYVAPSYVPAPAPSPNPVPALIALGGVAFIVVLVIAAVASADSATDEVNSETAETERETTEIKSLMADAEAKARQIDAHLDRFRSGTQRTPRD